MKIKGWLLCIWIAAVAAFLAASSAYAQTIYKWKSDKGQWNFSHQPPAAQFPVEELRLNRLSVDAQQPDCAPFSPGEIRTPKEYSSSVNSPLRLGAVQIEMVEAANDSATFVWRVGVGSTSMARELVLGLIILMDCRGVVLEVAHLTPTFVQRGRDATITGLKTIYGPAAGQVGRFKVSLY